MKILIVNYRYFISGGPEKYMFNVQKLLESKGYITIPFSVKNKRNIETEYSRYFVPSIGGEDLVYYKEYKKTPKTIFQMIGRSFYSIEVKKALQTAIRNEKVDAVYILHHVNKLSPSVISAAKQEGKRVVVRLSDFFLFCPRFDFLSNGEICERCLKGSLINGIKYNCVQNSKIASIVRVASMYFHRLIKIYDKVDYFVTPSLFLKNKLIEFGFNQNKVVHIPTFINSENIKPNYSNQNYILYLGRLNKEKGVEYAIRAMEYVIDKTLKLKIVGAASDNELKNIEDIIRTKQLKNIEILGFKTGNEFNEIIKNSKFTIVPSIWYDNMPNVILEAFAFGKPVIATNLGSLPELVENNINGLLFEPKDVLGLAEKINYLNSNNDLVALYGKNARKKVEEQYNSNIHYERLSNLLFRL